VAHGLHELPSDRRQVQQVLVGVDVERLAHAAAARQLAHRLVEVREDHEERERDRTEDERERVDDGVLLHPHQPLGRVVVEALGQRVPPDGGAGDHHDAHELHREEGRRRVGELHSRSSDGDAHVCPGMRRGHVSHSQVWRNLCAVQGFEPTAAYTCQ
tara:strand:+ start:2261 stop:2734 length:474 start_codon:yes stop_codon:yes gene_type:complete